VITLQKWDRKGIVKAHRSLTNRRYYTHEQYLQVIGRKAVEKKVISYCRVSSAGQKADVASQKTQDLLSIIHCFSSRLYGLRKYRGKCVRW
jgi:predicted site-specific integrase-resolvase